MKVSTHIRSARYEVMENGLPYFVLELENKEVSASVFLNRSKKDIMSTNVRFDPYKKEEALAAGDFLFVVLAMYAKGSRQEILDALLPVFNDGKEMLLFSNKSKRGYRIHKDHDKKREKDVITILATDQSGNKLLSMSSEDVKEVTLAETKRGNPCRESGGILNPEACIEGRPYRRSQPAPCRTIEQVLRLARASGRMCPAMGGEHSRVFEAGNAGIRFLWA